MIHYILQILAIQLLFLAVYDLLLKKETFFNGNRLYLIIAPILSFILPLIKVKSIRQNIPQEYTIQLPTILIDGTMQEITLPEIILGSSESFFQFITISKLLQAIWVLGIFLSTTLFFYKIYKIISLKKTGISTKIGNFTIISLPNTNMAFSFFRTIFIGEMLSEVKKTNILLHEKTHVSQYHSLDLIFFELLRIIFWFNPLVYVYQNRVTTLQEYIADAKAVSVTNKKEYYQDLLSQIFQTDKISFINTFFNHSLIKNRIVMLQKSKSKKIFQLKYLLLVPIIGVMMIYTSCTQEPSDQSEEEIAETEGTLIKNIEAVRQQIEIQGQLSDEEKAALNTLVKKAFESQPLSNFEKMLPETLLQSKLKSDGIPFAGLDKAPVFPSCENLTEAEAKMCFNDNIKKYVAREYNVELGKGLQGVQRIYVRFKIDKLGKVTDIKARAPKKELGDEAIRVIESLPQMKPGIKDGKPVNVLYSLPITFQIK